MACVSPYETARAEARALISQHGLFLEIFADPSPEACEGRDLKGLYRQARPVEIEQFTGVSDPYEIPQSPDLRIDSVSCTPGQNGIEICRFLSRQKLPLRHAFIDFPANRKIGKWARLRNGLMDMVDRCSL